MGKTLEVDQQEQKPMKSSNLPVLLLFFIIVGSIVSDFYNQQFFLAFNKIVYSVMGFVLASFVSTPIQSKPIGKINEHWSEYDTSKGHCGLCGRLDCKGNCYK